MACGLVEIKNDTVCSQEAKVFWSVSLEIVILEKLTYFDHVFLYALDFSMFLWRIVLQLHVPYQKAG